MKSAEEKYVALLRGINVSGKNMIRMPALVAIAEGLGWKNCKAYLQSGNLRFTATSIDCKAAAEDLSAAILKILKLDVPVMVLPVSQQKKIASSNPFMNAGGTDPAHCYVCFLFSKPLQNDLNLFDRFIQPGEGLLIKNQVVYLYCPLGYGRSKLNNNLIESKLKVTATTRNWKTVEALCG